jgi:hypothetical protein
MARDSSSGAAEPTTSQQVRANESYARSGDCADGKRSILGRDDRDRGFAQSLLDAELRQLHGAEVHGRLVTMTPRSVGDGHHLRTRVRRLGGIVKGETHRVRGQSLVSLDRRAEPVHPQVEAEDNGAVDVGESCDMVEGALVLRPARPGSRTEGAVRASSRGMVSGLRLRQGDRKRTLRARALGDGTVDRHAWLMPLDVPPSAR